MLNFHSALFSLINSYGEFFPWDLFKGRDFCQLISYESFLSTKGKIQKGALENIFSFIEERKKSPVNVKFILDCGAFSALRQGFSIDLDEYISFVKNYSYYWDTIVALDVINDPESTWKNYVAMLDSGCRNVMPVYHVGEPDLYLCKYSEISNYVGFSPPFGLSGNSCIDVYQSQLYDGKGSLRFEGINFHGFGIGSPLFFQIYPWYSCDSSNAALYARYGSVFLFKMKGPVIGFSILFVSSRQKKSRKHYVYLDKAEKRRVDALFEYFGFSYEDFNEDLVGGDEKSRIGRCICNRVAFNISFLDFVVSRIGKEISYCLPNAVLF